MGYKYLLDIGLIILLVKIFSVLTGKIKMPKVLGGLIAGILLGPAVLNIVQNDTIIEALSECGIILIMLLAGMETSMKKFISNGGKFLIVASMGVIIPLFMGTLFSFIYVQDLEVNLFFGAVITATSVSMTVESLIEMKKMKTNVGTVILGAGVVDDIIGIIFLSIIMNYNNFHFSDFAITILKIVLFLGIAICVGLILFKLFEKIEEKDVKSENTPTYTIAFAFILAYIGKLLGLSEIVGAYIAGLVIGNTEKGRKIENKLDEIVYSFFSPIFAASIGLKLETISFSLETWIFIIIFTIVTIVSKIIGNGAGAKICGYSNHKSIQIGIGMATRGEIALIMTEEALNVGLINEEIFSIVVIVVLLVTFIAPILLYRIFKKDTDKDDDDNESKRINEIKDKKEKLEGENKYEYKNNIL